jgi:hypothetical protein
MRVADKLRQQPEHLEVRNFEKWLRRNGFTSREAKTIISEGFKSLLNYRQGVIERV